MESKLSMATFKEMLCKKGFDFDCPDPKIAWDTFKEFSKTEIECNNDAMLFQCGIYNFTGKISSIGDLSDYSHLMTKMGIMII